MAIESFLDEEQVVSCVDHGEYADMDMETLASLAVGGDQDAYKELARRAELAAPRTSDFNYQLRHLPGSHDQSTHGHGGAVSFGAFVPGVRRPGAGDGIPFPRKGDRAYDDLVAGSGKDNLEFGPDGEIVGWKPEVQARHDAIVAKALSGVKPVAPPAQPEAIILGGGSGAGKTSNRNSGNLEGVPPEGSGTHVDINADVVKESLPEFKNAMEGTSKAVADKAAGFSHEESAYVALRIQAAATERRMSFVVDGTGDGGIDKLASKVEFMKTSGYRVNAVYSTVPLSQALSQVTSRATHPAYAGATFGRNINLGVATDLHISVSRVLPRAIDMGLFDSVKLFDTRVRGKPVKVFDSKLGGILDADLWGEFIDKGNAPLSKE